MICRKVICLLLFSCFMLLVGSSTATANEIDLKSMSVEELQELRTRIDKELLDRQGFSMWFDYGVGLHIPKISLQSGKEPRLDDFQINDENSMYVIVKNHDEADFDAYIEQLMTLGFLNDVSRSRLQFSARNEEGYAVQVTNYSTSGISIKGYPPARKK